MPNWCNNKLEISGPPDIVAEFIAAARGPNQTYNQFNHFGAIDWGELDDIRVKALLTQDPERGSVSDLSFHALYPVPLQVRKFPYSPNLAHKVADSAGVILSLAGYDWEIKNWGVKWGASDVEMTEDGDPTPDLHEVTYFFATPWAAPFPFLDYVADKWPKLSFNMESDELGNEWAATSKWADGKRLSITERNIGDDYDFDHPQDSPLKDGDV